MFDHIIINAMIIDGTGAEAKPGWIGIKDGKIETVNHTEAAPTEGYGPRQITNAAGRYLTPGFIDIHRHGDIAAFDPDYGKAELAQGLTTVVNGNCGLSAVPIPGKNVQNEWMDSTFREDILSYLMPVTGEIPDELCFETISEYSKALAAHPSRIHNGMLLGMGTVRAAVSGFRSGPLTKDEILKIQRIMLQELSAGALGVSMGLGYAPECFYSTEELIRVLAPLHNSGVPVTVHMRQEGDGVVEALEEMLTVARAVHTPLQISHLKAIGTKNRHKSVPQMLKTIRNARKEGLDISCDCYPYPAGSTQLIHVLPPEFQDGGIPALVKALKDPNKRSIMRSRMETGSDFENISLLVGWENIQATSLQSEEFRPYEGNNIAEIAAALKQDPYDALFDLLAAENAQCAMIDRITSEDDIAAILKEDFSMVISDATYPKEGLMHPRVYGNTAHLFERFVYEKEVISPEAAVRKITSLPAEKLNLKGKGRIAPGMDADLCLFNGPSLHETGTFAEPRQFVSGMDMVFVMGEIAYEKGKFTEVKNGTVL